MELHPLNDWAKTRDGVPGIPVRQHLLATACVAEALLRRFPRLCERCGVTPDFVLFLAASHDVGKLSLDFLRKSQVWLERQGLARKAALEDWKTVYHRPHPLVSARSMKKFVADNSLGDRRTAACWAAVVGAHHGRIAERYSSAPFFPKKPELPLEDERQGCFEELRNRFSVASFPEMDDENDSAIWCMAGFVTLADWLASDEDFFPSDMMLDEAELRMRAISAVEAIGFGLPSVRHGLSFSDIFSNRSPYPMQSETASVIRGPGTYVIEAPMGMGKTEAALWASYNLLSGGLADGVFFALPTQATSNRMFLRFSDFVRKICPQAAPVQLVHGGSWLLDDLKGLVRPQVDGGDSCWFDMGRRPLFAPFGVGTVDQALLSVLPVRHFALRRFALSGKVVILDEMHSYDMYTGRLVRHLCDELRKLGCTVIVLSATLTERARDSILGISDSVGGIPPYPRIGGRIGDAVLPDSFPPSLPDKTVHVGHPDRKIALESALELAGNGARILWICDTISHAQKDFAELRAMSANAGKISDIGVLHSRFPFWKREGLETEWMAKFGVGGDCRKGAILVSTQIVEQSVDLDADVIFSELAPTDMLLQRIGRLWRHPRAGRPLDFPVFNLLRESVTVKSFGDMNVQEIKKNLGEKASVYSPYVLLRTLEIWETMTSVSIPSEIRSLMMETYAERDDLPDEWMKLFDIDYGRGLAEERLADMNSDVWQTGLDDDAILATRLGMGGSLMVLCRARDGNRVLLHDGEEIVLGGGGNRISDSKALHRNSVRIPDSCVIGMSSDAKLTSHHVDGLLMIGDDGSVSGTSLRKDRRLSWDDDLGIVIEKEGIDESC